MTSREETRQKLWCDVYTHWARKFHPKPCAVEADAAVAAFDKQFPKEETADQPGHDPHGVAFRKDAKLSDLLKCVQSIDIDPGMMYVMFEGLQKRVSDLESHGTGSMAMVELTKRMYALENAGLPEGIVVTQPEEESKEVTAEDKERLLAEVTRQKEEVRKEYAAIPDKLYKQIEDMERCDNCESWTEKPETREEAIPLGTCPIWSTLVKYHSCCKEFKRKEKTDETT